MDKEKRLEIQKEFIKDLVEIIKRIGYFNFTSNSTPAIKFKEKLEKENYKFYVTSKEDYRRWTITDQLSHKSFTILWGKEKGWFKPTNEITHFVGIPKEAAEELENYFYKNE